VQLSATADALVGGSAVAVPASMSNTLSSEHNNNNKVLMLCLSG
jgi:hypothetical protein